ncbi:hypothetical protein FQZ97_1222310 [compost metagenome]
MATDDNFARLPRNNLRDAFEHLHNPCVGFGRANREHTKIDLVGQLDHDAAFDRNNRHIRHRFSFRCLPAF